MQALPQLFWLRCLRSIIDFSPLTVTPETIVSDAIALMANLGKSALVVSDDQVLGWLTNQDVVRLVANQVDFSIVKISEVMHTSNMTLKLAQFTDISAILSSLRQCELVLLLVVDEQEQLIGTVTPESICQLLAQPAGLTMGEAGIGESGLAVVTLDNAFCTGETAEDIQACRQSEERFRTILEQATDALLRENERRFRAIFNGAYQLTGLLTPEGIILELNQAAIDFLGLNPQALIGLPIWETRSWSRTETQTQLQQAIALAARGEFVRYEMDVISANSTVRTIDFSLKPIANETGKVVLIIAEGRDISELKQAQAALQEANIELERRVAERTEALKEINRLLVFEIGDRQLAQEQLYQSQQMLQLIMDNIPQSIFWKDRNSVYLGCNRNFARDAGWENPEDIVGKTDYDFGLTKEQSDVYRQYDVRVMQTNTPRYHIIETKRLADGKQIWLDVNKIPLHDDQDQVVGVLGTYEDITERKLALKELEKSEERFRFLAESIPQQVWISSADGHVEYVNQRTLDYFACTLEDIQDRQWQQWLHPEDQAKSQALWQTSLATGTPLEIEYRCLRRTDNTYRWHLVRALPLQYHEGNIVNWFGTNTDIHDRVTAEVALRESQQWYQSLTAISPVGIFHTDATGNCLYVNGHWCEIAGMTPEEAAGSGWLSAIHPEDRERIQQQWYAATAKKLPFRAEYRFQRPDGSVSWVMGQAVAELGDTGEIVANVGTITDITDRKRAEEELRQNEEYFRLLVEGVKDYAIYLLDPEGLVMSWNSGAECISGYKSGEIIGENFSRFFLPEDIANAIPNQHLEIAKVNGRYECENILVRKDGSRFWADCILTALRDDTGKLRGFSKVTRDITERKLVEESLLRLRKAIESTSDAVSIADITGRVIYVNPAFHEVFDYSCEQMNASGGSSANFRQQEVFATVFETLQTGESWRGEVMMATRSGGIVQIELRSDAIKDATGKIVSFVSIYTDITQRKLIEEGLRLRDRAIAASSNGIVIADATMSDGPIIYVNPAFEQMTGYSSTEVIGQNFRLLPGADINQLELQQLSTAMQQGQGCTLVFESYRKDGTLFWNELNISPVYDTNNGELTHYIGIQTDITERKQAETSLLVSQQRLQYLLTSSPAVIYSCQASGNFDATFMSANVKNMLGYEGEYLINNPGLWLTIIHPEDRPQVLNKMSHGVEQGEYKVEYRWLHPDNNYRWIYDKGKMVRDEGGNPIEFVGYLSDITDRKQLEQELRVTLDKEKELNELKSRFISMTSHEFRTPLSTILSSSELLEHYRHRWTEEKQLTHLHRIQIAVKRMTEMLSDVLFIGKAEAGKLEYTPTNFDLIEYCRQMVAEIEMNVSNQHQISFTSNFSSIPCFMDEKLLGHILSNLLSNAVKYSPSDSLINLTLTCVDERAIFEIQDQGIGIPQEDLPRLFESFHRAGNVGNIIGTGLGLAIVKKCLEVHQGTIEVKSTLGKSTVFTVTIPLNNQIPSEGQK
ncbi:MAG: PAS domain S-box protein [Gloeotrichia echinulata CP02]